MSKEVRDKDKVYIVWSYEDVQSLIPNMSKKEAIEALSEVGEALKQHSTSEGWQILETALEAYGYDTKEID